jgi:alkylation response protein AidB-like acyl-CoA dehydrogenase
MQRMLESVRKLARSELQPLAAEIDRGRYPREILQRLGTLGAFGAHLQRAGRCDFASAIGAIAEISRVCGATGFLTWCQAVCSMYLEQAGNPALTEMLGRHERGEQLGGTGLSNPMKALAGIEPIALKAQLVADGYVVNGILPWVSNIGPGHYFGTMARVTASTAAHDVMFIVRCDAPGVELRRSSAFSGMEGTSTCSVRLRNLHIGRADIIAEPAQPFIERIRGAFILLQAGIGLGVAQGAIDSMRQVEIRLGHVNRFLPDRPEQLQVEQAALTARVMRLAAAAYCTEQDHFIEVLDARAQVSEFALRTAQSALLHQGARGYVMSSPVQRRIRESHFVAIVTPALKHLRSEIERLTRHPE